LGAYLNKNPFRKGAGIFLPFLDDKSLKIYHFSKTSKIAQFWHKMAEIWTL